jgi:transposase
VKFSFIAKHRGIWAVDWMCEALGVSRGGFYAWLTLAADIELLDKRLVEIVATDAALAHRYRLLTSMPGVGPVLACTLIVLLPELGGMTHKQVAALVGVAPSAFESGHFASRTA